MAVHQKSNANQVNEAASKQRTVRPVGEGPVVLTPQLDPVVLRRAIASPGRATPADILALQRAVGNRAVTRLIQPKLMVGPVGDVYEREADRVAEQVVSAPVPRSPGPAGGASQRPARGAVEGSAQRQAEEEEELQMKPLAASITPLVQRQAEEEEELQMKPALQRALTDLTRPQAIQRAGKEWEDLSVKERTELWEKFTTAGPQGQAKPPREMVEEESFPLGPISSEVLARGERARQARGKGGVGQTKSPEEKGPAMTAGGRTDVHEQFLAWEPEEEEVEKEAVSVGEKTTLSQGEDDSGLLSDILDSVAALAERVTKLEKKQ